MSERVLIPHSQPILKQYVDPKPAWGKDEDGLVWLRCNCGCLLTLPHSIATNGDVSPSLWHDDPKCGWHVYGTLVGWANEGNSEARE